MKALCFVAVLLACAPASARDWRRPSSIVAPTTLSVALQFEGHGNPTGFRGAWCAAFVSQILRSVGLRPLPNLMADSALGYGPRTNAPRPGDIAVMRGHVGFVVADHGARMEIVSGNWGKRVKRAILPRWVFVAFIRV